MAEEGKENTSLVTMETAQPGAQEAPPLKRAEAGKRIAAALVDGVPAYLVAFIPYLGGLISAAYLALRDGLPSNGIQGQSLGKRLFGLKAVRMPGGESCDYTTSVLRNLPFVVPALIMIRPGMGWVLGSLIWIAVFAVETLLVIADEKGERLGDRLAKTTVVETL
jgi:uncharacterized RDD family membrane protein YckC